MTAPTGIGPAGLGWHFDGDRLVLVVGAASAGLRRELGPTPWSVLETLVLAARRTGLGGLVAGVNGREIATAVGVGRDAATKALALLRARGLIMLDQPRGDGGQFRAVRYEIRVQRVGVTPRSTRRTHTASVRQQPATMTLFDPPTVDISDDDRPPDPRRGADCATDRVVEDSTRHTPISPPDSRDEPHTLALSMRTDHDPGGDGAC